MFQHGNIRLSVESHDLFILLKEMRLNDPEFGNNTPYGNFWGVMRSLVNLV